VGGGGGVGFSLSRTIEEDPVKGWGVELSLARDYIFGSQAFMANPYMGFSAAHQSVDDADYEISLKTHGFYGGVTVISDYRFTPFLNIDLGWYRYKTTLKRDGWGSWSSTWDPRWEAAQTLGVKYSVSDEGIASVGAALTHSRALEEAAHHYWYARGFLDLRVASGVTSEIAVSRSIDDDNENDDFIVNIAPVIVEF